MLNSSPSFLGSLGDSMKELLLLVVVRASVVGGGGNRVWNSRRKGLEVFHPSHTSRGILGVSTKELLLLSWSHSPPLSSPRPFFRAEIRGYLPSLQKSPVKSSMSRAQTMAPPKLFFFSQSTCGEENPSEPQERIPQEVLISSQLPPDLDAKALDVVVADPFAALVGVGNILGFIPSLGGSRAQQRADLGRRKQECYPQKKEKPRLCCYLGFILWFCAVSLFPEYLTFSWRFHRQLCA